MAGVTDGSLDFGHGMLTRGGFVAAFLASGAVKWIKPFPRTTLLFAQSGSSRSLAVTHGGDILFAPTLTLTGDTDFGCGPVPPDGESPMRLVRLDAGGHCRSVTELPGFSNAAVAVAADDAIVIGGTVDGLMAPHGAHDIAVLELEPSGATRWSRVFGDGGEQSGYSVAVDPRTRAIGLTGSLSNGGPIDFGQGPVPGDGRLFAAVLGADGSPRWSGRYGDGIIASGLDVAFAPNGLVVVGEFSNLLAFGPPPFMAQGSTAGFIADLRWQ